MAKIVDSVKQESSSNDSSSDENSCEQCEFVEEANELVVTTEEMAMEIADFVSERTDSVVHAYRKAFNERHEARTQVRNLKAVKAEKEKEIEEKNSTIAEMNLQLAEKDKCSEKDLSKKCETIDQSTQWSQQTSGSDLGEDNGEPECDGPAAKKLMIESDNEN